jgi:predicted MFS family arabinose efflux permease
VALNQALGWRWTWWLSGAFNLVFVCTLILLVIRERPRPDENAYGAAQQEHEHVATEPDLMLRDILSRRNFWIALAGSMPPLMANNAMSVNFAPFAANRGATVAQTAALLATFSIAAAVGKLGCGVLADRYGDRFPLMLLGLSSALGLAILAVAGSVVPLAIGFVLLAFGQGAWVMLASCIASEFGARGFRAPMALPRSRRWSARCPRRSSPGRPN